MNIDAYNRQANDFFQKWDVLKNQGIDAGLEDEAHFTLSWDLVAQTSREGGVHIWSEAIHGTWTFADGTEKHLDFDVSDVTAPGVDRYWQNGACFIEVHTVLAGDLGYNHMPHMSYHGTVSPDAYLLAINDVSSLPHDAFFMLDFNDLMWGDMAFQPYEGEVFVW